MPKARSKMTSTRVIATIGVARICTQAVAYSAQTNSGIRCHVMPGARRRWIVVMKLMPVRIEENPNTKAANTAKETLVPVRML